MKQRLSRLFLGSLTVALSVVSTALGQEITIHRSSDDWTYEESRPGLRQRGDPIPVLGALFYRRKPLPEHITKEGIRLTTSIGAFQYREHADQFGARGWLPAHDETTEAASSTEEAIQPEELTVGFYRAGFDERKKGTPLSWVFIEATGKPVYVAYWADPTRLDQPALK